MKDLLIAALTAFLFFTLSFSLLSNENNDYQKATKGTKDKCFRLQFYIINGSVRTFPIAYPCEGKVGERKMHNWRDSKLEKDSETASADGENK